MPDTRALLERYTPRLVYDSQEAYFADSAAVFTDSPTNTLRRGNGATLATPPKLSLAYLGPHTYKDGTKVLADDLIGDTTRTYAKNATAIRNRDPRYRDRVYGHARVDSQGRLWLQYWLFYYYNDYQLVGSILTGGKHEGDWELVQLRLGRRRAPGARRLLPAQDRREPPWATTPKQGDTPLVYVARGSHANYFSAGSHFTGTWFDQADGKGPQDHADARDRDRQPAGLAALARPLGRHQARLPAAGLAEPEQPRPAAPTGWTRPSSTAPSPSRRPPPPAAPKAAAHRSGDHLVVAYDTDPNAERAGRRHAPEGLRRARHHPRVRDSSRPRARWRSPPRTATTTSGRASSRPTAAPRRALRRRDELHGGVDRRARERRVPEIGAEVKECADARPELPRVSATSPALAGSENGRGRTAQSNPSLASSIAVQGDPLRSVASPAAPARATRRGWSRVRARPGSCPRCRASTGAPVAHAVVGRERLGVAAEICQSRRGRRAGWRAARRRPPCTSSVPVADVV